MSNTKPTTITEYINIAPTQAQKKLREIYSILKKAAPKATETIKWRSPMFEGFAAFKSHLNCMPTPSAMKPCKRELANYSTGKGSIQFPYDKPLPKALNLKLLHFVSKISEKKMLDDVKNIGNSG